MTEKLTLSETIAKLEEALKNDPLNRAFRINLAALKKRLTKFGDNDRMFRSK